LAAFLRRVGPKALEGRAKIGEHLLPVLLGAGALERKPDVQQSCCLGIVARAVEQPTNETAAELGITLGVEQRGWVLVVADVEAESSW
jgi:hypothetical protein